jgi:hypothetical protein
MKQVRLGADMKGQIAKAKIGDQVKVLSASTLGAKAYIGKVGRLD